MKDQTELHKKVIGLAKKVFDHHGLDYKEIKIREDTLEGSNLFVVSCENMHSTLIIFNLIESLKFTENLFYDCKYEMELDGRIRGKVTMELMTRRKGKFLFFGPIISTPVKTVFGNFEDLRHFYEFNERTK